MHWGGDAQCGWEPWSFSNLWGHWGDGFHLNTVT